jgi:DNA replication and repair protein RecF
MKILRLDIDGLRCVQHARIVSTGGVQFLLGANGAGKTTVLEAMHLLGYGRSFRSGQRDAVIQRGASESRCSRKSSASRAAVSDRVAAGRATGQRLDGPTCQFRRVVPRLPSGVSNRVACPHRRVSGGSPRFLDWTVFHVEQTSPSLAPLQRALNKGTPGCALAGLTLLQSWSKSWRNQLTVSHARRPCWRNCAGVKKIRRGFSAELGAPRWC